MAEHTEDKRQALITALTDLAASIEKNPPPVVGSDIFVSAGLGGNAVGSSIAVTAAAGGGAGTGQRVSVVADRPGQSVIGQQITVVTGDAGSVAPPWAGAQSTQEVIDTVQQLRDAAKALETSPASKTWIKGILEGAEKWGSAALSGAISGAADAATSFYLGG